MRFVPIKSADQQTGLMRHKTGELLVKQRTMSVNALLEPPRGIRPRRRHGHCRIDELSDPESRRGGVCGKIPLRLRSCASVRQT
jgi:hypothetical protein